MSRYVRRLYMYMYMCICSACSPSRWRPVVLMPHVPCDYIMGIFLFKAVVCQGGLDFIVQLTQFMKRKTLPRAGNPAASRSVCAAQQQHAAAYSR
jgi:hypothetical protein